ncbi:hypothetical protein FIBSPDRAFT_320510 [Athelia psychrophila]|uniref:Uncharacterized protein n=1 Tax=Athelia psychrophila TaxID=1759441 RepID=A0A166QHU5_9AGAM|nr:hypothetical protein FIBSPDRAFT_320510 [Fibularhizoctonia sp. CBS 109695]
MTTYDDSTSRHGAIGFVTPCADDRTGYRSYAQSARARMLGSARGDCRLEGGESIMMRIRYANALLVASFRNQHMAHPSQHAIDYFCTPKISIVRTIVEPQMKSALTTTSHTRAQHPSFSHLCSKTTPTPDPATQDSCWLSTENLPDPEARRIHLIW